MSLTPGITLGPYQILSAIGAGGMGQVYRARDTKLGREVAIKVLPEEFTQHPQKLARFEREARLLAALNHPGIATLYGVEEAESPRPAGPERRQPFLVMELVEGETLAERIACGPLPVTEALTISRQIAGALEAAHEKGVIHRDLKPANIKVDPEGHVKVLDFGLAKLAEAEGDSPGEGSSRSPTLSRDATRAGVILGTAAYMSPEQAKGKAIDKRTDIFSFGIVLYEMLTGRRAFSGEDASDVLASILKTEPDWKVIPSDLDPRIQNLLRRCLRKDRKSRLQAIGDVRVEIEDILTHPLDESRAATAVAPERASVWRAALLAAMASAAVAGVAIWNLRPSEPIPEQRPVTRLSVTLPEEFAFTTPGHPKLSLAVSPDGRRIVYVGRGAAAGRYVGGAATGGWQLYSRSLESLTVEPIEGTEGASQPFFSPDGNWVGFFTPTGELKKVRLDGGSPVTLVRGVPNGGWAFGAWGDDGTIVFDAGGDLLEISDEAGAPSPVFGSLPRDESIARFPVLVEATGDVLFVSYESSYLVDPRIEVIDGETSEQHTVLENALPLAVTRSGHLLFVRDQVVMAAAYGPATHGVGAAVPLPESIARDLGNRPQLAVSGNGILVYVPSHGIALESSLGWVTRAGEFDRLGAMPAGLYGGVHLSPDGRAALISVSVGAEDQALVFDLSRGLLSRLNVGGRDFDTARWHPDGRRIGLGGDSLRLSDLDSGEETILAEGLRGARSPAWTPDGRTVAFMAFDPNQNIYALHPDDEEPRALIATSAAEHSPAISPDGRWIAYVSDETGQLEVYVARFPEGDRRRPITANGGSAPLWSRDGRELFFTEREASEGRHVLRAVPVSAGDALDVGQARTLFVVNDHEVTENFVSGGNSGAAYDVSADGTRFLMIRRPVDARTEIVVVENWHEELKRLVPAN